MKLHNASKSEITFLMPNKWNTIKKSREEEMLFAEININKKNMYYSQDKLHSFWQDT